MTKTRGDHFTTQAIFGARGQATGIAHPSELNASRGQPTMIQTDIKSTRTHSQSRSRGANTPEFCSIVGLPKTEGAGNAGAQQHPQPRMQKKAYELVTTGTPKQSGIPCTIALRLIARSPRRPGFDCLRRLADYRPQNLTPASGGQDHTPLPSASGVARQPTSKRPSHPAPNVRDDREAPLSVGAGREEKITCF